MSNIRPTKKQYELLGFIGRFITEHGYSPSYREIMHGLQYTSVATVALHVNSLIKRGHLRKRDHSARSLEVVQLPAGDPGDPADHAAAAVIPVEGHITWLAGQAEAYVVERLAQADGLARRDGETVLRALKLLGLEDEAAAIRQRAGLEPAAAAAVPAGSA